MNLIHFEKIKNVVGCPNEDDIEFIKNFPNQGKQGIVGLVNIKNNILTYKMSQYINHIVLHEASIMNSLNTLRNFCPHFCKYLGVCTKHVNGNYRKLENPFKITTKHPIKTETLLMEYIDGKKLYTMIKNTDVSEDILFSAIKQLLFAISIAQTKKKFTHYDLHSCNVLMKQCKPDTVHLYVLDEHNQFVVPTYGYYPVIIDFGFSYSDSIKGQPIYSSLAHTDVGFMTNQFDTISDPKLLLVSISDEIKRYRSSETSIKFRNIVRNIYSCLDIDWESGWDNYDTPGAADHIVQEIDKIKVSSNLFTKYPHYCVDLVQTLIHLPLEKLSKNNLDISYITMVNEFYKIEKELTSSIYHLYIFKNIVDSARRVKALYHSDSRKNAINIFKKDVIETVMSVAKFCCPKNLHYEKLLCSLYCFANCSQRILFDTIKEKNKLHQEQYKNLELETPEHIYGAIEINIPQKYKYNKNTNIIIYNSITESTTTLHQLPEKLINILNSKQPLVQGSILYEYQQTKFPNCVTTKIKNTSKINHVDQHLDQHIDQNEHEDEDLDSVEDEDEDEDEDLDLDSVEDEDDDEDLDLDSDEDEDEDDEDLDLDSDEDEDEDLDLDSDEDHK